MDHLYTGAVERDEIGCYNPRYISEGTAFKVYAAGSGGLIPVKRFYQNLTIHNHFYAVTTQDIDFAHSLHYSFEGVAFLPTLLRPKQFLD